MPSFFLRWNAISTRTEGWEGFQAGYNYQAARVVYGVEADLTWTGQRDSFNFTGTSTPVQFEDFNYQETTAAKLQYMGTVRGRIGYAFGEFLPYITGGLAWGRMAMDLNWTLKQLFCQNCVASFSGSESHTLFGWNSRRRLRICVRATLVSQSRISLYRSRQENIFRRHTRWWLFRAARSYCQARHQFPPLICRVG